MPVFDLNRWPEELLRAETTITPGDVCVLPDTDEAKTIADLATEQRAFLGTVTGFVDVCLPPEESENDGTRRAGMWTGKPSDEDK